MKEELFREKSYWYPGNLAVNDSNANEDDGSNARKQIIFFQCQNKYPPF